MGFFSLRGSSNVKPHFAVACFRTAMADEGFTDGAIVRSSKKQRLVPSSTTRVPTKAASDRTVPVTSTSVIPGPTSADESWSGSTILRLISNPVSSSRMTVGKDNFNVMDSFHSFSLTPRREASSIESVSGIHRFIEPETGIASMRRRLWIRASDEVVASSMELCGDGLCWMR